MFVTRPAVPLPGAASFRQPGAPISTAPAASFRPPDHYNKVCNNGACQGLPSDPSPVRTVRTPFALSPLRTRPNRAKMLPSYTDLYGSLGIAPDERTLWQIR